MKHLVVLDTNCLLQSLPAKSIYHRIWTDYREGRYLLCVSNSILHEYEEIIGLHSAPHIAHNIVDAIINSPFTIYKEPYYRFGFVVNDPDDNKFVDCAYAAEADLVVTDDTHFDTVPNIPFIKFRVIKLTDFLHQLEKENPLYE